MSQVRIIAGTTVALLLLGQGASVLAQGTPKQGEKKIYCWNEGGKKVCGDALPASATDSARTEISTRSGLTTGRLDRALTDTERSAAAVAAEAAREQADAEARQLRRDLAMVESYATEADLRRAYGDRTSLLDETLKASRLGLSNLRLSLLSLLRQAGDQELAGTPVPQKLSGSIQEQHAELLRQQQILAAQELDRSELEAELQDSVRRYREMKGEASTDATAPPAQEAATTSNG